MIKRNTKQKIEEALCRQSVVGLIGPRQVGKTTLALEISKEKPSIYLDLESAKDRSKLAEPQLFMYQNRDKLIILDEIHRTPELFQELRGIIDERRREGRKYGQFLILGSASIDLLNQSSETLAGRIEYIKMGPLTALEIGPSESALNTLWTRGGFPDSYLSKSDENSFLFRESFIQTYLEREVQLFVSRIPTETLRRLWTMLAHNHGGLLNASKLASNLSVTAPTITSYVDLLVDLFLVRRLQPYHANVGKRLIKSPKTYVKDSGILHALLNIETFNDLMGHPVVGNSWEGFVIENILSMLSTRIQSSFYRTAAGAEIDLILDFGHKHGKWAIEIKRSLSPKLEKGFISALESIQPQKSFIVYSGKERYPISKGIEVISLREMCSEVQKM